MPSVSKAQARFVRHKAAEGATWAKQWASEEGDTKRLPERKLPKAKRTFVKRAGVR
jgi:hypothetical protein